MHGLFVLIDRRKNRQLLNELDLTPDQARDIILHLDVDNYSSGPYLDSQITGGEICEFGIEVDGKEIYIKIAVVEKYGLCYCKCISFHEAERPMDYPLKGGDD